MQLFIKRFSVPHLGDISYSSVDYLWIGLRFRFSSIITSRIFNSVVVVRVLLLINFISGNFRGILFLSVCLWKTIYIALLIFIDSLLAKYKLVTFANSSLRLRVTQNALQLSFFMRLRVTQNSLQLLFFLRLRVMQKALQFPFFFSSLSPSS